MEDWRIGGLERHQLRIRCGRNLMVDVSQREGKNGSSSAEMFPIFFIFAAFGIICTTALSTRGRGTNAVDGTPNKIFASETIDVKTAKRPYALSPIFATILSATSR